MSLSTSQLSDEWEVEYGSILRKNYENLRLNKLEEENKELRIMSNSKVFVQW